MKITQIFRIEDGILSGTEIEIIMGFYAVKYPHRQTKDMYVPPMEANGKKLETFHCCQDNCSQPDFEGTIEALIKHIELHAGRLLKKAKPITKKNPAVLAVKLPPNPWDTAPKCNTNDDRQFVVKSYIDSVKRALNKQGVGILEDDK